jgi:hypothetical protein
MAVRVIHGAVAQQCAFSLTISRLRKAKVIAGARLQHLETSSIGSYDGSVGLSA